MRLAEFLMRPDLLADLDRARVEAASAFVVVTVDLETGDVVNACGPFAEPEQALVQAGKDSVAWRALAGADAPGFRYVVVPLWEPSP